MGEGSGEGEGDEGGMNVQVKHDVLVKGGREEETLGKGQQWGRRG